MSALIELSSSPIIDGPCPLTSLGTRLDWSEFARGFLAVSGEDGQQEEQLLNDLFDASNPPDGCRRMVLDACAALLQEVCARFPEVDRAVRRDFPSSMPPPDKPDVFAYL